MSLKIIAGKFKSRILKAPIATSTRPTQGMLREAVFNICQNEVENTRFLDLFAGSGAMGLEAISRGASHATFVEQNRLAASCIKSNIDALQVENQTTLLNIDVTRAITTLAKQSRQFDLIYIDPPYDLSFNMDSLTPLLAPCAMVLVEERYDPKKVHHPLVSTHLHIRETRRFGIALLSIFDYK